MTKRIFINTFGFTETAVLAPVVKLGIGKDDFIILLLPEGLVDQRTLNATENLRNYLRILVGEEIQLESVEVPINDFIEGVIKIRDLIKSYAEKGTAYINLSGGMRVLILETYTAALIVRILGVDVKFTEINLEGAVGSVKILPIFPAQKLDEKKLKLLKEIVGSGEVTLKDLSRKFSLSLSTIFRNISSLKNINLVEVTREGRKIKIKPTDYGKILSLCN